MQPISPKSQLAGFLAKYTPGIGAQVRTALKRMRARLPGSIEMVYDNFNALVIGFGPTERPSEAIFSIAVFPDHVTLCFLQGAKLPDPKKLLKGGGNQVRHIRLEDTAMLDKPDVKALMARAVECSAKPWNVTSPGRLVIRSISAKQRPRRPVPDDKIDRAAPRTRETRGKTKIRRP